MCGIVGIFSKNLSSDAAIVRAMNDAIYRRGPDDEGYYLGEGVHLGMRRLSIIDISAGHQPIFNEDESVVIVFNGEIYNHLELRESLLKKGHVFKTHSDTEVIVHLYEEYGIDFLQHLRGMFGICIWDIAKRRGYLCRDRFGIKPMYTAITGEGDFIFGSELKSIIATQKVVKDISLQGLDAYLAYNYIPAPLTIYKNIFKLSPAHYIEFSDAGISAPIRYWDANTIPPQNHGDQQEVEAAIKASVTCHMESDVPVGAFLSGGIDSSLVTAMASSHEKFSSAYTIGFENITRLYDERPLAQYVSQRYAIKKHELVSVKPNPEAVLTEAILAFDEPFADDSIIPTWEICKLAAKDVKVCLTGLGGDELFGGYYRYLGIKYYEIYAKFPLVLRKLVLMLVSVLLPKSSSRRVDHIKRFFSASVLPSDEVYISYLTSLAADKRQSLYASGIQKNINLDETKNLLKAHFNACTSSSLLQKAIYTDINSYVPEDILALSDRVSMWHSLELRVPLMDHVLFSHTYGLADKFKINRKEKKIMLRDIARAYLPKPLFAAKKQGFESPMAEWINGELASFVDTKLSVESLNKHKIFNVDYVANLLTQHRQKISDNTKLIFSILMFQIWFEEVYSK